MVPVIKSSAGYHGSVPANTMTTGNISVATGDLIVACYFFNATEGSESLSDTQSNTYTKRLVDTGFASNPCVLFSAIAGSTGTLTITANAGASSNNQDLIVYVIDGTTILSSSTYWDQAHSSNQSGSSVTSADSGNTAACAGGDELVLGFAMSGTTNPAYTAGSGFTLDVTATGDNKMGGEHKTQSGVTTGVNATFTLSPGDFVYAQVAVIRGTPAAGGLGPINPGQTWRRYFWRGLSHPIPGSSVAGGNVTNTVTASDTLAALTDVATRAVQSFTRTASDSLAALSDTATRSVQAFTRTASDSLAALSDTATRAAQASNRTATDSLSALADSASRALQSFTRTATDSLAALSDVAARSAQQSTRTASQSVAALSDTVTRTVQAFVRTASDTLAALSDQAFKAGSHATVTAADTLSSLSDTATRAVQQAARTVTESLAGLTDSATRAAQAFLRSLADAIGALVDVATVSGGPGSVSAFDTIAYQVTAFDAVAYGSSAFDAPAYQVGAFDSLA